MRLHYLPQDDPQQSERWLPGYPASDHDEADPARVAVMLASGLYAAAAPEPPAVPKPARPPAPHAADPEVV